MKLKKKNGNNSSKLKQQISASKSRRIDSVVKNKF